MKRLTLAAVALVALSYDIEAMENKPTTELKIVNETSFCVYDRLKGYTNYEWCENFRNINMKGVNFEYEKYGKEHDVDVATLRGDNFQPREFWTQPFVEIIKSIFFDLVNYKAREIIYYYMEDKEGNLYCFGGGSNESSENENSISLETLARKQGFPIFIEDKLQFCVYLQVNEFMKKRNLPTINYDEFRASLRGYCGKSTGKPPRATPIFEYLAGYIWGRHFW